MNWGTGIAIFYSLFVVIMIFMVVRASQNSVELVQPNYYEKDINYESFRQSRQNYAALPTQVKLTYDAPGQSLTIVFPPDMEHIIGEVKLYRPSNKFQDKVFTIKTNEQKMMTIDTKGLPTGFWRVLIQWSADSKNFYMEEVITL